MAQQTYTIVATDGNVLQTGLYAHNVAAVAEYLSDERGEHVTIVGGPDNVRETVKPQRLRDDLVEDARLLARAEYDV